MTRPEDAGTGMILHGDALDQLRTIPDDSINCCVTSPPYWGLRDYGVDGQLGLEETPEQYVQSMVAVFREVRRVLRRDGTLWLNLGDSYATGALTQPNRMPIPGLKPKDLVGIPWRVAFALQADGWYLRQDIIWSKPNPMPESVRDRCTKAHEYLFLLAKSERYWFDNEAIKEPAAFEGPNSPASIASPCGQGFARRARGGGKKAARVGHTNLASSGGIGYLTRNKRSVWRIATVPTPDAHFATFPPKLIEPCVRAGCPVGGTVLDPFLGSGTTAMVAESLNRKWIGIELNAEYIEIAKRRIANRKPDKPKRERVEGQLDLGDFL